ncbi:S-Ena type endospore appendage [Bacillus benzoevorans]|uniref:Endospore appendages core domain-containing protein n=1 Tax=Bacillus benzoevorans TaxID=1456 RepID=A0A7X0HTK3_9BACI|nr:S-Ena type endospore appendage [Bacillus benzoevorans]MBB6445475.1 hypothetical protein [Bacillus benzoevorans]
MKETNDQHCIKALQIHDWVTRPIKIKRRTGIFATNKTAADSICGKFRIAYHPFSSQIIWIGKGVAAITGSFTIKFNKGSALLLDIMVNHQKAATLRSGQSFSATVSGMQVVELACRGVEDTPGFCEGDFHFHLHYRVSDPEGEIDHDRTEIFYSDSSGNRLNPAHGIECIVLFEKHQERNDQLYQEIPILLHGYITIRLYNKKGDFLCSFIEPFSEIETFCLCYPPGSFAACEIINTSLKSLPIPKAKDSSAKRDEILLHIILHLNVEVLCEVIISLKGNQDIIEQKNRPSC